MKLDDIRDTLLALQATVPGKPLVGFSLDPDSSRLGVSVCRPDLPAPNLINMLIDTVDYGRDPDAVMQEVAQIACGCFAAKVDSMTKESK